MNPLFRYSAFKALEVIDGDSIRVDLDLGFGITKHEVDVRLKEWDAPENRHKNPLHKKAGIAVTSVVKLFFALPNIPGAELTLISCDLEDLYGRVIGDFAVQFESGGKRHVEVLTNFLTTHNLVQALDRKGKRRSWTDTKLQSVITNAAIAKRELAKLIKESPDG